MTTFDSIEMTEGNWEDYSHWQPNMNINHSKRIRGIKALPDTADAIIIKILISAVNGNSLCTDISI